jgi:hypothetical protein
MKSKKIVLPIYPFEFMVSIGQTNSQLLTDFNKYWDEPNYREMVKEDVENMDYDYSAYFKIYNCQVGIFRFKKKPTSGIIVHECFHACSKLMKRIGQELVDESEESYAYLMQYIFEQIENAIK